MHVNYFYLYIYSFRQTSRNCAMDPWPHPPPLVYGEKFPYGANFFKGMFVPVASIVWLMVWVFYLQLEEHINIIALSGDWVKLVDGLLVESSVIQSATSTVGTTQKRGFSGRRNRKLSAASEVTADGCHDQGFCWWQGGKLSKLIFQRAILPRSVVKKAARQCK